ncbi:MAG: ATP-binding protein [Bifidobacteriaceae bacterium]|jgi:hypothetical protein|nr:ATP-binding protein [Bifidobacteriaceae bacterium]
MPKLVRSGRPPANPFTPSYGSDPVAFVGRETLIDDVLAGLENGPGDPNRSTVFTGPRGSGKTVLLRRIEQEARQIGWVPVAVAALPGMLDRIVERIRVEAAEFLAPPPRGRITSLTVQGTGIGREAIEAPLLSWQTRMGTLLDELAAHNVGLLITIDEIDPGLPELSTLGNDFQFFVGEKRQIAIVMAGLPTRVYQAFTARSTSFLRRSFHRQLEPLRLADAKAVLRQTVESSGRHITQGALTRAATAAHGLPFLVQLIGYHTWRQTANDTITADDVTAGVDAAEDDQREMLVETTLREVSPTDLAFLRAMAQDDGESVLRDIAARMGVTSQYAGTYRLRLIRQGLITPRGRGRIVFALPFLKEWLRDEGRIG